jgi:hypothetical protein
MRDISDKTLRLDGVAPFFSQPQYPIPLRLPTRFHPPIVNSKSTQNGQFETVPSLLNRSYYAAPISHLVGNTIAE